MASTFEIGLTNGARTDLVVLRGEIDLAAADRLAAAFDGVDRDVVVDCADLDFIDSYGIKELLRARLRLNAAGCELRLIRVPPFVERVLALLGVRELL